MKIYEIINVFNFSGGFKICHDFYELDEMKTHSPI